MKHPYLNLNPYVRKQNLVREAYSIRENQGHVQSTAEEKCGNGALRCQGLSNISCKGAQSDL